MCHNRLTRALVNLIKFWLPALLLWGALACAPENTPRSLVNLAHLNALYQEATVAGQPGAFIYIYAEHPDYHPVEAPGEGIACVDDAARAALVYLRHFQRTGDEGSLQRTEQLLGFLLAMQAPNGLFYNFILKDYSINRTRHNSLPRAEWWTWRALWAMAEALPTFHRENPRLARRLDEAIDKVFPAVDSLLQAYPRTTEVEGFAVPAYLPGQYAADQGAILLLGLAAYYRVHRDSVTARRMRRIGEGLLHMQVGDYAHFPYGVFLSWKNIWHAWGNSQAHALLEAGQLLPEPRFVTAALQEIRHFYPYLIRQGFLREMHFVRVAHDSVRARQVIRFPQIAYDIRPMVMACLAAHRITGDAAYSRQAGEIAAWLLGRNPAEHAMYNPVTGRCFDGILGEDTINRNSGAESTIEALLTLLAVEEVPRARKALLQNTEARITERLGK